MVIDRRSAAAFAVGQTRQAELGVAASPHRHLVVVHTDRRADVPVRRPIGCHQHQTGPFDGASFQRVRARTALELLTITGPENQRR